MKLQLMLLVVASLLIAGGGLLATSGWLPANEPDDSRTVLQPVDGRYLPVVMSSDLAVGPSRLVLGLTEQETGAEVLNADLGIRLFEGARAEGAPVFEGDAIAMSVTRATTVEDPSGGRRTVESSDAAAYVASVEFTTAGIWTAEITGEVDGEALGPVPLVFSVREESESVPIGSPAPRTEQLTLKDVDELSAIDTSAEPDPEWHQMTVAEALDLGKPVAVAFTTPGFCTSQLCAPITEALAAVYPDFKDAISFVHIEPYDLAKARSGEGLEVVPAMEEWGLTNEPWIFVVGANGRVAAKFEGFASQIELEQVIGLLLGQQKEVAR